MITIPTKDTIPNIYTNQVTQWNTKTKKLEFAAKQLEKYGTEYIWVHADENDKAYYAIFRKGDYDRLT